MNDVSLENKVETVFAEALKGDDAEDIIAALAAAGYDESDLRQLRNAMRGLQ